MASARNTWKLHKYSSIALIPFITYLLISILRFSELSYEQILLEISSTWSIFFILIFMILGIFHMNTGINEIMDDYVHDPKVHKLLKILISSFFTGISLFVCLSVLMILL
jgi:succinate dehydrogenase / fumarate reductase membrane anchor subunit